MGADDDFKVCSRCKNKISKDKFYKRKLSKDGLNASCKNCLKPVSYKNLGRDLTNIRFDSLVVLRKAGSFGNGTTWECVCDCGNKKVIRRPNLMNRGTKSCGCLPVGVKSLPSDVSSRNAVWGFFVQRARKRKMEFSIPKEVILDLVTKPCFYCGLSASNKVKKRLGEFEYNGLDRIDNRKGYTIDNVLVCCKYCNALRMDVLTVEETVSIIRHIKGLRGIETSPWIGFERIKRDSL